MVLPKFDDSPRSKRDEYASGLKFLRYVKGRNKRTECGLEVYIMNYKFILLIKRIQN